MTPAEPQPAAELEPALTALFEAVAQEIDKLSMRLEASDAYATELRHAIREQDGILNKVLDHIEGLYTRLEYLGAGEPRTVSGKELGYFISRSAHQTALNVEGEGYAQADEPKPTPQPGGATLLDLMNVKGRA